MSKQFNIQLSENLQVAVRQLAAKYGTKTGDVVAVALIEYIERHRGEFGSINLASPPPPVPVPETQPDVISAYRERAVKEMTGVLQGLNDPTLVQHDAYIEALKNKLRQ